MAVIINELEVVVEAPAVGGATTTSGGQAGSAAASGGAGAAQLTPADLADVAERRQRQTMRLLAH